MGFVELGHQIDQMIKKPLSFLDKLHIFPNENLRNQITHRLRLNVFAKKLNVIFI